MLINPSFLAVLDLREEEQLAVIRAGDAESLAALSRSPFLRAAPAEELVRAHADERFIHALRAVADGDVLSHHAARGVRRAAMVARSAHAPVAVLDEIARSRGPVRFWALANARTSEDLRRAVLDERTVEEVTMVGQSNSDRLARGMELAFANPWLADRAEQLCAHVARALAIHPDTRHAAQQRLGDRRWPMTRLIPAGDVRAMSVDGLLGSVCSTTALAALERDDLSFEQAARFCTEGDQDVEAPILARFVRRFGVGIASECRLSATKRQTLAWLEPGCSVIETWREGGDAIARALGGNAEAWRVFFAITRAGHQDLQEMTEAALQLAS